MGLSLSLIAEGIVLVGDCLWFGWWKHQMKCFFNLFIRFALPEAVLVDGHGPDDGYPDVGRQL